MIKLLPMLRSGSGHLGAMALILLGGAQPALAETFDLKTMVFCPTEQLPCGFADEAALRASVMDDLGRVNRQWQPNGISFRPISIDVTIGGKFVNLSAAKGQSASDLYTNEELFTELQETFASDSPEAVGLFLIPGMAKCWSSRPWNTPEGDPRRYGAFCGPMTGNTIYAHELGHHFCLSHTFTGQDTATHGAQVSWDGDRIASGDGLPYSVADTPGDPGKLEGASAGFGSDQTSADDFRPDHEWCESVRIERLVPVDQGSFNRTHCVPRCFRTDGAGVPEMISDLRPLTENSMSYWGAACKGPYVVNGIAHEAFTSEQADAIQTCRENINERVQLADVCAGSGDRDSDGWCDFEDSCPDTPNTATQGADADGDGLSDACDPCVLDPVNNQDTDGDGLGDACGDLDDDDDGCPDGLDQHPLEKYLSTNARVIALNCPVSGVPSLVNEGADTDGDFLLNCLDRDDDNDTILDVDDACPFTPGEVCVEVAQCPVQTWYDVCLLGGCDQFVASFETLINPDPTRRLILQDIVIEERTLYIVPDRRSTISQQALALVPAITLPGPGLALASDEVATLASSGLAPTLRIAIRSKATLELVAVVADFHPLELERGEIRDGTLIAFTPDPATGLVRLETTWGTASPSLLSLADRDGDGVPDPFDNCADVPNPGQRDTDGDSMGNFCDADLDGDGLVSLADLDRIAACRGFVGDYEHPFVERGLDDEIEEEDHRTPQERQREIDAAAFQAARWDCEHSDLDGSGTVTEGDLIVARELAKTEGGQGKVPLCHRGKTLSVGFPAVFAHVDNHGDQVGECR